MRTFLTIFASILFSILMGLVVSLFLPFEPKARMFLSAMIVPLAAAMALLWFVTRRSQRSASIGIWAANVVMVLVIYLTFSQHLTTEAV